MDTPLPDIWSLPIDADRGVAATEEPVRLTTAQGADTQPSVSLDGVRIAFRSQRSGQREVWLLDAVTGSRLPLTGDLGWPVLNAAGSRLAVGRGDSLSILFLDGIVEKQFQGTADGMWH